MNRIVKKIVNIVIPSFIICGVGVISCYLDLSIYVVVSLIIGSGVTSSYLCNKLFIVNNNIVEKEDYVKEVNIDRYNDVRYVNNRNISKDKVKKRVKRRN